MFRFPMDRSVVPRQKLFIQPSILQGPRWLFMGRPYKCPYCRSTRTIWKGHRKLAEGKVRL